VTGITNTIGNSLAILSLDDEFKRRRLEEKFSQKSSSDIFLHGGKVIYPPNVTLDLRYRSIVIHF
jgi:hypothetical protein